MAATDAVRGVLIAAAREFNAGRYFEAHEVLEEGLESVPDELWELFVGLIQIAVGYHKLAQGRWSGARTMLELGLEKVEPFAPDAAGLQLEALRRCVRAQLEDLHAGEHDADAVRRQPPRIQLVPVER